MTGREKISSAQFSLLIFYYLVGTSLILNPAMVAKSPKQDAWISCLLASCIGLLLAWLISELGQRFQGRTLVEYAEQVVGVIAGKTLSLILLLSMFIQTAQGVRVLGNFMITELLPETPFEAIIASFLLLVVMGARYGIETLGRTAQLVFPAFFILFCLFVLLIAPKSDLKNLQPVLEANALSILQGAQVMVQFPLFGLVFMLFVYPSVKTKAKSGYMKGTALACVLLTLIMILCLLVLGPEPTIMNLFPSFELAKAINIVNFLERLEVIMTLIWLISIYFRVTILFYAISVCFSGLLKLRDFRPFTLPLGLILFVFSLILSPNIVLFHKISNEISPSFSLLFGLIVPLILLLAGIIRKKNGV